MLYVYIHQIKCMGCGINALKHLIQNVNPLNYEMPSRHPTFSIQINVTSKYKYPTAAIPLIQHHILIKSIFNAKVL